jgi:hypothetical protein
MPRWCAAPDISAVIRLRTRNVDDVNWNEIKVYLAPMGSEVRISPDFAIGDDDHSAPTVLTISPPLTVERRPVHRAKIELWFELAGFRATQIKLESSRYEWEDISAAIVTHRGLLASVLLSFKADASLRERMLVWDELVGRVCETNLLEVVNPVTGFGSGK